MAATFYSNTIWYLLLGTLTVFEMFIVLKKSENHTRIISLFLFISGMTFSIEVVIYCFFKAYNYYPMILPHSPIDDGLAGNLFSQFSITATALIIIVSNLKYYWYFIFAGLYGIIEELFLKLGIYSHNWYRTWITVIGLIILFAVWKRVSKDYSFFIGSKKRYISFFFGLYTLHMILVWWPLLLASIVKINMNIFSDPFTSYTFVSFLNLTVLTVICLLVYFSHSKWLSRVIEMLLFYSIFYLSEKFNIIHIKTGWSFVVATIDILGMLLFVYFLDKLFKKL